MDFNSSYTAMVFAVVGFDFGLIYNVMVLTSKDDRRSDVQDYGDAPHSIGNRDEDLHGV